MQYVDTSTSIYEWMNESHRVNSGSPATVCFFPNVFSNDETQANEEHADWCEIMLNGLLNNNNVDADDDVRI